ncbi:NYN domain-containing protein [Heliobacterium undosum]|uniref:NYN domain-containing protein n=1 Tax=Heliomicrobium undosum TaxID=121734 RepID=A0A845L417_9FIRM|nr:NYN domain-containing protein [Heliomicrobium undosum]MZP29775.1 NYN domain-containing protein [Heliomicrobium undosum]
MWIEGQRLSAIKKGYADTGIVFDTQWVYDFEALLYVVADGEYVRAKLYASEAPGSGRQMWGMAEKSRYAVELIPRSAANKEKAVDTKMIWDVAWDMKGRSPNHNKVTIVAGDKDFLPAVEGLREAGFFVTVASWEHSASGQLKRRASRFICLDDFFHALTYYKTTS